MRSGPLTGAPHWPQPPRAPRPLERSNNSPKLDPYPIPLSEGLRPVPRFVPDAGGRLGPSFLHLSRGCFGGNAGDTKNPPSLAKQALPTCSSMGPCSGDSLGSF